MSRISKDEYFMSLAELAAKRTTCIRRGVGCVLVSPRGHVLSIGYNGVAAGLKHCNAQTGFRFIYANGIDKKRQLTGQSTGEEPVFGNACRGHDLPPGQDKCEAIHAEQNALLQCQDPWQVDKAYVTLSPCMPCLKLLLNTSCGEIIYLEEHTNVEPLDLWLEAGRTCRKMSD